MKRFITLLFVLIFAFCYTVPTYAQAEQFSIKAEEITAKPGETVTVKFSFENNPGIAVLTLGLEYDKSKLTLKEIKGNTLMGGSFVDNVEEDFILWMSNSKDSYFNGTVFSAVFEVKRNAAGGKTTVTATLPNYSDNILNYNGDDISAKVIPGSINIKSSVLKGDANSDGIVNFSDLAVLRKSIVTKNSNGANTSACDMNSDSQVDIRDLVMLNNRLNSINM